MKKEEIFLTMTTHVEMKAHCPRCLSRNIYPLKEGKTGCFDCGEVWKYEQNRAEFRLLPR